MKSIISIFCLLCALINIVEAFLAPISHQQHVAVSVGPFQKGNMKERRKYCSSNNFSPFQQKQQQQQQQHSMPSLLLQMKKKTNDEETEEKSVFFGITIDKSKPGTFIIAPFVAIFFLDIVANLLVVTKRTIEVALTGEYTVWHF